MLDNRAIAFDGIGQPLPLLVRDGLWPIDEEPPTDAPVDRWPGALPRRKRTKRVRRDEETILFLARR